MPSEALPTIAIFATIQANLRDSANVEAKRRAYSCFMEMRFRINF